MIVPDNLHLLHQITDGLLDVEQLLTVIVDLNFDLVMLFSSYRYVITDGLDTLL